MKLGGYIHINNDVMLTKRVCRVQDALAHSEARRGGLSLFWSIPRSCTLKGVTWVLINRDVDCHVIAWACLHAVYT